MAYKLERAIDKTIELEVGSEILTITISGVKMYRKVLEAQSRLKDIQKKISIMEKANNELPPELIQFLGESVLFMFQMAFGEDNAQKILDFYEGNYDEMLLKVYPFFINVFLPALKQNAQLESRELAEKMANDT